MSHKAAKTTNMDIPNSHKRKWEESLNEATPSSFSPKDKENPFFNLWNSFVVKSLERVSIEEKENAGGLLNYNKLSHKELKKKADAMLVKKYPSDDDKMTLLEQIFSLKLDGQGLYYDMMYLLKRSLFRASLSPNPIYHGGRSEEETLPGRIRLYRELKKKGFPLSSAHIKIISFEGVQYFLNGRVIEKNAFETIIEAESLTGEEGNKQHHLWCIRFRKSKVSDKVINKIKEMSKEKVIRENCVRCLGQIEERRIAAIVTEHHGQSLEQMVTNEIDIPPEEVAKIIRRIVEGVRLIHDRGEALGSLNPNGIMIDYDETSQRVRSLKIDLLSTKGFGANFCHKRRKRFIAPELRRTNKCTIKGDVYSVGKIIEYIIENFTSMGPEACPHSYLQTDPEKRPKALDSNDFVNIFENLEKLE